MFALQLGRVIVNEYLQSAYNALLGEKSESAIWKILISMIAAVAVVFMPLTANASDQIVIEQDHTDAFYITTDTGTPVVQVANGTFRPKYYDPNKVVFRIGASTFDTNYPFTHLDSANKSGYYTSRDDAEVWFEPGWNAPKFRDNGFKSLTINFTKVTGPGKVSLFSLGDLGEADPIPFLNDNKLFVTAGTSLPITGHQHAHWFFDRSGTYRLTGEVVGVKDSGESVKSQPFTSTFEVEKNPAETAAAAAESEADPSLEPEPEAEADPSLEPEPEAEADPEDNLEDDPETDLESEQDLPESPESEDELPESSVQPGEPQDEVVNTPAEFRSKGHLDAFYLTAAQNKLQLLMREDITGRGVIRTPESALLVLEARTYQKDIGFELPEKITSGYTTYYTSFSPGWSSQDYESFGIKSVELEFVEVNAPGKVVLFYPPNLKGEISQVLKDGYLVKTGSKLALESASHTHGHWLFTKPGDYTFKVQAVGKLANGETIRSDVAAYRWKVEKNAAEENQPETENPESDQPAGSEDTDTPWIYDPNKQNTSPDASEITPTGDIAVPVELDHGHIDLLNVVVRNGKLILNTKDDTAGREILRDPNSVTLRVKDTALTNIPENMRDKFGPSGYLLGKNGLRQHEIPFPGWDTSFVPKSFGPVEYDFLEVKGPGKMFLFDTGRLGGTAPALDSGSYILAAGEKIIQKEPGHVHANWLFEKPGKYTMKVRARVAGQTSNTAVFTWLVGTNTMDEKQNSQPSVPPVNNPQADNPSASGGSNTDLPGSPSAPSAPSAPPSAANGNSGNGTAGGYTGGSISPAPAVNKQKYVDAIYPRIKDDRTQPAKWVDPSTLVFAIGSAGKATTAESVGRIPAGSPVWMISSSQVSGVPWLGVNSQHPTIREKTTGYLKLALTSFSGPGAMEVFYSNNFGGAGQRIFSGVNGHPAGAIVLNPNVHAHPNWIFSQPGTYKVGITTTVTLKNGRNVSNSTVLTFNVGSGSGITNGHFDLGAEIGKALAGSRGTTNASGGVGAALGSRGQNVAAGSADSLNAGEEALDANGNPLDDENGAKKLSGSSAKNTSASSNSGLDADGNGSWWNSGILLGIVIALLLVNAALMTVRVLQARKAAA
ncbi:TIGR03773 family transporter-associated surface protein [Arcanobacterium hippocoleae]